MYLRFTTLKVDEDSKRPQGVFAAAYLLLDSGELSAAEWKQVRTILDWYKANLPVPPKSFEASRAIFWFRDSAAENIKRIWDLVAVLRAHGRPVNVLKCRHLANISYRDELQVAAYPSADDAKVSVQ